MVLMLKWLMKMKGKKKKKKLKWEHSRILYAALNKKAKPTNSQPPPDHRHSHLPSPVGLDDFSTTRTLDCNKIIRRRWL